MTIALNCSCSAHLEVDEAFLGRTIACPDCGRTLDVIPGLHPPRAPTVPLPASGWAIASLTVALVGLFTVVGSVLGIALGWRGLRHAQQDPSKIGGSRLAWAGIGVGFLGLLLTGGSLWLRDVPVVGPGLRWSHWVGRLDFPGSPEVVRSADGFVITLPGKSWGVVREGRRASGDSTGLSEVALLVDPVLGACICCFNEKVDGQGEEAIRQKALEAFRTLDLSRCPPQRGGLSAATLQVRSAKQLSSGEEEILELLVDKHYLAQERTYIVRIYHNKRNEGLIYLVAGGAPRAFFARAEGPIRAALDSFRLLTRDRPWDMQRPPN